MKKLILLPALMLLTGCIAISRPVPDKHITVTCDKCEYNARPIAIEPVCDTKVRVEVPSGYYKNKVEKHWIPGKQVVIINEHDKKVVRYIPGHFETREILTWVEEY
jgi:hypothetical protein